MHKLFGILFFAFAVLSSSAFAQSKERLISTNGECSKSVVTDRAKITMTAVAENIDVSLAMQKTTSSYEALKKDITALQLKNLELESTEYSVNEIVDWTNNKRVSRGFQVRMGLSIATSEINRMGQVILLGAKHNIKDVGALSSFLSREKSKAEYESCLGEAVKNSKDKAVKMADAAKVKLGSVLVINESSTNDGGFFPTPVMHHARAEKMSYGSDQGPSIEASNVNMKVQAQVSYSIQ